jgi:hypothetical protein
MNENRRKNTCNLQGGKRRKKLSRTRIYIRKDGIKTQEGEWGKGWFVLNVEMVE